MKMLVAVMLLWSVGVCALEDADTALTEIVNYRQYSGEFSSSGQPTPQQFEALEAAGFERIVYLAFSDDQTAIAAEDRLVKDLAMEYLQIPVAFGKPLPAEFYAFADFMRRDAGRKTLLHCQVNMRASAFSFLYRVIYENVPVADAKEDMNSVWQPNTIWRDFIFAVLAENKRSPDCEVCDWTPPPPMQH